jgi:hypothetical protein
MNIVGAESGTNKCAVRTADNQHPCGDNVADPCQSGNEWEICPHCGQPEWLERRGAARPLRRFPPWRAGGAYIARAERRGGKRHDGQLQERMVRVWT